MVRLSRPAVDDLAELRDFIADRDGVERAHSVLDDSEAAFSRLALMPRMGRLRPDLTGPHTRWSRVHDWLVLYDPSDDGILVLRVIHGRRDLTAIFSRDL